MGSDSPNEAAAHTLLAAGTRLDLQNEEGETALEIAESLGSDEVAALIRGRGPPR